MLQLSNDFSSSSLYRSLFDAVSKNDVEQSVFSFVYPNREQRQAPRESYSSLDVHEIPYRRSFQKAIFLLRSFFFALVLCKQYGAKNYDLVHAHTLYSEGFVAYLIFKLFGVPYIVSVRNTDLNYYHRFRPDLRWIGRLVLGSASRVIFLNKTYMSFTKKAYPKLRDRHCTLIPNGIGPPWLECGRHLRARPLLSEPIKYLYVGDSSENKNVAGLIQALQLLPFSSSLSVVGFRRENLRKGLKNKSLDLKGVTFLGRINDKIDLRKVYSSHHVFCMASHKETFGLVYLEAIAMGLPLVLTRGQGAAGWFDSSVCVEVDSRNTESIAMGMIKGAAASRELDPCDIARLAQPFSWESIGRRLSEVYLSVRVES